LKLANRVADFAPLKVTPANEQERAQVADLIEEVQEVAAQKKKWISIGIRIAGSWIFAISLLMIAFALRRHP